MVETAAEIGERPLDVYGFVCDEEGRHLACRDHFVGTWAEFHNPDDPRTGNGLWYTGVPPHLPPDDHDRLLVEAYERMSEGASSERHRV
jgi:hypothetical protein